MSIMLRKADYSDKAAIVAVEKKATPNLSYLAEVFSNWVTDKHGEFIVAEVDDNVVACGKLSVLPDGSAWLEALRVMPAYQGIGIGKRFYQRFFEIAREQGIPAMRMYTGVGNAVSKGLAERFGFHLAATYRGAWISTNRLNTASEGRFTPVEDADQAVKLLMPYSSEWTGFLIMNRTFYALTPALCRAWAKAGMVYEDGMGNVIAVGARFMEKQALHIACMGSDLGACLSFAQLQARTLAVPRIQCMFPPSATHLQQALIQYGFELETSDFIVMEAKL